MSEVSIEVSQCFRFLWRTQEVHMCHMCRLSILNKLAHVSLFTNLASWPKDAASFSTPQRWPGCCGHSSGLFSGARNLRGGFSRTLLLDSSAFLVPKVDNCELDECRRMYGAGLKKPV